MKLTGRQESASGHGVWPPFAGPDTRTADMGGYLVIHLATPDHAEPDDLSEAHKSARLLHLLLVDMSVIGRCHDRGAPSAHRASITGMITRVGTACYQCPDS